MMRLVSVFTTLGLLVLILYSDAKHSSKHSSKNRKRWTETSSIDDGLDQADTRSKPNNGGFSSMDPGLDSVGQEGSLSLGLADNSELDAKNDYSNSDLKEPSKQGVHELMQDDMYAQDIATYLKPGIGDYPSDMPTEQQMKMHGHHGQHPLTSFQQHTDNAYLLEDAASNLAQNTDELSNEMGNNNNGGNNGKVNADQEDISPAKVIDSALEKITSEASSLMKNNDKEEHQSSGDGSGDHIGYHGVKGDKSAYHHNSKEDSADHHGDKENVGGSNHGDRDDENDSDEAFVLKLAGANSKNHEEDEKQKKIREEKLKKEKEEKEKEKSKETEENKQESSKEEAQLMNEGINSTKEVKNKVTEDKPVTEKEGKSAAENSDSKQTKDDSKAVEGTRRQTYNALREIGMPSLQYKVQPLDDIVSQDESSTGDAKQELPAGEVNDQFVSSLKQALIKNVKEMMDENEGSEENKEKEQSQQTTSVIKEHDPTGEGLIDELMESAKIKGNENSEAFNHEKADHEKLDHENVDGEKVEHKKLEHHKTQAKKPVKAFKASNHKAKSNTEKDDNEKDSNTKIHEEKNVKNEEAQDEHQQQEDKQEEEEHKQRQQQEESTQQGDSEISFQDIELNAVNGDETSDMLEADLMKVDKKKLVHMLAQYIRRRKKSGKSDSAKSEDISSSSSSELSDLSAHENNKPNLYFHSVPTEAPLVHHEVSSDLRNNFDPYADVGSPDPDDGAKPKKPSHRTGKLQKDTSDKELTSNKDASGKEETSNKEKTSEKEEMSNKDDSSSKEETSNKEKMSDKEISNKNDASMMDEKSSKEKTSNKGDASIKEEASFKENASSKEEESKQHNFKEGEKETGDNKEDDKKLKMEREDSTKAMEEHLQNEKEKSKNLKENEKDENQEGKIDSDSEKTKAKNDAKETSSALEGEDDSQSADIHKNHYDDGAGVQMEIVDAVANNIDDNIVNKILQSEKSLENPKDSDDISSSGDVAAVTSDEKQSSPVEHLSPSSSDHHTSGSHSKQLKEHSNENKERTSNVDHQSNHAENSENNDKDDDDSNDSNIKKLIHKIKQKLLQKSKLRKLAAAAKTENEDVYAQIGSSNSSPSLRKRFTRVKKHRIHHATSVKKHHRSSKM